jgi:hypothetical protein
VEEATFWQMIGLLGFAEVELPGTDAEDEAAIRPLVRALVKHPVEDIDEFYEILAQKLHAIDTERHWRKYGWPSEDSFLYARCWVVARGQAFYETVLRDPEKMPRWVAEGREEDALSIPSPTFEALLGVAPEAYELRTGEEYHYSPTRVSFETGHNSVGWPSR